MEKERTEGEWAVIPEDDSKATPSPCRRLSEMVSSGVGVRGGIKERGRLGAREDEPIPYSTAAAKSLLSCTTLCDPIDGSPPGSPIPGILQARTLEWGAIAFSIPYSKPPFIIFFGRKTTKDSSKARTGKACKNKHVVHA